MTTSTLEDGTPESRLGYHIEPFLKYLRAAGYAERTLRKKRTVAKAFARWMGRKHIAVNALNDSHIAAFVARSPRRRKSHVKSELAAMVFLFEYLRGYVGLQSPPTQTDVSAADDLLQRYVYVPFIREFLAAQATQTGCVSPESFDASFIRTFILEHTHDRSSESIRLLCTALRSFFRFLVLCGHARNLSFSIPMVRKYRQTMVPAFLSSDEVEHVLAATLSGRRDYAILLLLARLGLRAGDCVSS